MYLDEKKGFSEIHRDIETSGTDASEERAQDSVCLLVLVSHDVSHNKYTYVLWGKLFLVLSYIEKEKAQLSPFSLEAPTNSQISCQGCFTEWKTKHIVGAFIRK